MSYADALPLLLKVEGGYQLTDPPEGPTFAGILQTTWFNYLRQRNETYHWPPKIEDVGSFYANEFWIPRHCDELPHPADTVALQMLANLPPYTGNRLLQCALQVDPDGMIGPKTRAMFTAIPAMDLAERILVAQAAHYCANSASWAFRGLINRVTIVRDFLKRGG